MKACIYEHHNWEESDINDYVSKFGVLVLFKLHLSLGEAEMIIYHSDKMTADHVGKLKEVLAMRFGGTTMNDVLADTINEFAIKWYNKNILKKISLVVNGRKRK